MSEKENKIIKAIKENCNITKVEFLSDFGDEMYYLLRDCMGKVHWFDADDRLTPTILSADEFFEVCDFIGVDSDEVAKNDGGCYPIKQSCIDFELWCDNVQICGYYDQNNKFPQFRFTWYDQDGFERDDIDSTKPYLDEDTPQGFKTLVNWCMIVNLVNHFDLVSVLLENRCNTEDVKITFGAEEHPIQVELWIKGANQ